MNKIILTTRFRAIIPKQEIRELIITTQSHFVIKYIKS